MNVFRIELIQSPDDELDAMWDEIEEWEQSGVLSKDSLIRRHTTAAYASAGYNVRGGFTAAGDEGLQCTLFSHEVWREIARRARDRRGVARQRGDGE